MWHEQRSRGKSKKSSGKLTITGSDYVPDPRLWVEVKNTVVTTSFIMECSGGHASWHWRKEDRPQGSYLTDCSTKLMWHPLAEPGGPLHEGADGVGKPGSSTSPGPLWGTLHSSSRNTESTPVYSCCFLYWLKGVPSVPVLTCFSKAPEGEAWMKLWWPP